MNPFIGIDVTFDAVFISVPCDPHIAARSMNSAFRMVQISRNRGNSDCLISRRSRAYSKRH